MDIYSCQWDYFGENDMELNYIHVNSQDHRYHWTSSVCKTWQEVYLEWIIFSIDPYLPPAKSYNLTWLDSTSWTWSTSRNPEITQNNNYYVHSSNYYTPGEGVRIKYNQWGWLFVFYNVSAAFQPYNRGKKYYWCLVPK